MKRVLNSGSINLLGILGTEENIFEYISSSPDLNTLTQDESLDLVYSKYNGYHFSQIVFKFQVKAPILILQSLQKSRLGTLESFPIQDTSEVYLPPSFYRYGSTEGFLAASSKECNDLNTKYSNFYRNVLNFYQNLLKSGVCQEQADLVLPLGLFVTFNWVVNAQDVIKFIEKNYNESPELSGYCSTFVLYLEDTMPIISDWLKRTKWQNYKLI